MNAWDAVVALAELVVAQARLQTRLEALEDSHAAFLCALGLQAGDGR